MKFIISISVITILVFASYWTALAAANTSIKVFKYQGDLPIKDDRTGGLVNENGNPTNETIEGMTEQEQSEAEAACWKLINEQSGKQQ